MNNTIINIPKAINEPVRNYAPGSAETVSLKSKLTEFACTTTEIPVIIGGKEIFTGQTEPCIMPHDHRHILGEYHKAGKAEVDQAVQAALNAAGDWAAMPYIARVAIFKKMAELLAGPYRDILNAATMLGQSKNVYQAEIDSACELIDFFNFNSMFMQEIYQQQPPYSPKGTLNMVQYRPLEGFVFAVTPFNFTSIAGNLPTAPALMGNVVLWKPASASVLSGYYLMQLFKAAGLPDGVINFIPGPGGNVGNPVMENEHLTGIHFTGSTSVFQNMWKKIGNNIANYKTYPRIVGETGGKDFIVAHESADPHELATAMVRGAFEYQGQKCSAASRCYIPKSIWKDTRQIFTDMVSSIKVGDVQDFTNFMNAVIDDSAFDSIAAYIDFAKNSDEADIITGGNYNKSEGYFIDPTTIVTTNPHFKTMEEEIFGPVLTIFVYDSDWDDTLRLVDRTSPYSLTGAVFARERKAINRALELLMHASGNFYINDKPTGAVVGQQPFGGSRASGTNDKAGSPLNLLRWVSQRTIKETFIPPRDYFYPFMKEK